LHLSASLNHPRKCQESPKIAEKSFTIIPQRFLADDDIVVVLSNISVRASRPVPVLE
jgi:hypothetical protein